MRPGSWFHVNECFGPVLGIMHAETLEQAIEWQNSTGYAAVDGSIFKAQPVTMRNFLLITTVRNCFHFRYRSN